MLYVFLNGQFVRWFSFVLHTKCRKRIIIFSPWRVNMLLTCPQGIILLLSFAAQSLCIRYNFSSNHNIHKSLCDFWFSASETLIDRFYYNLWIKGSEAEKQRQHKLLWMLWFDKKVYLLCIYVHMYEIWINLICYDSILVSQMQISFIFRKKILKKKKYFFLKNSLCEKNIFFCVGLNTKPM